MEQVLHERQQHKTPQKALDKEKEKDENKDEIQDQYMYNNTENERGWRKEKKTHEDTDKKEFKSVANPHDLIRDAQKHKYIWYAAYGEELLPSKFRETLQACSDNSAPIVPWSH